jgi:hypothetical protein
MKIAYLLFAYKNPKLMKRMIDRLTDEKSAFFIHIDKKSDMNEFSQISGKNIYFHKKPIPVYWAEYSGVQAILNLIRQSFEVGQEYDYHVLLSGSEYPIRSKEYINQYFDKHCGAEFINMIKMPSEAAGKPISRINTVRIPSQKTVYRLIVKILARAGLAQRDYRKYLGNMEPYAGNTWWALTRDACHYILEFEKKNPKVSDYFKNTFAPEEMYFHTILGNSEFKPRIRRNLIYEDWSQKGGHPVPIRREHIDLISSCDKMIVNDIWGSEEMLFARKFSDDTLDLTLLVDNMVRQKERRNDYHSATV